MEVEDKYEKLRVVGRGAFGICWLCKKKGEENAEKVIIKTIPLHGLSTKEEQEIKGEADLLRKMNHPMIIGYYDYFTCTDSIAIVMQFAEGGTLENLIRDQRGVHFSEAIVLKYFTQILLGLEYMHSLNIVHRDLKTQNILLNRKRTLIKLSDFGVSKQLNTRSVASTLIGTPNYLSPEMVEGRSYNMKSDIWALGCVLYELFMLRRAFDGENLPAIVMKITQQKYAPLGNHVSKESRDLVGKILSGNEDSRPTVKDIMTCPLILSYTLTVVLDTGRIMGSVPEKRRSQPTQLTMRARTGSDSIASSPSTTAAYYRTQNLIATNHSSSRSSFSTTTASVGSTTYINTVRKG
ncbi:hypothetical protein PENTCL1PPCAC_24443 [Pristionchus entomophagus]|uniref:non-specific serine/threonine protein kinase n=1 Tax=Pristionchus entomophagus TaxID=358040 RepID=A0AAV5U600_9BILA|nr:hypothetical protein PENTCL1PPCAC_24443 [Pristionchus entomophagus]